MRGWVRMVLAVTAAAACVPPAAMSQTVPDEGASMTWRTSIKTAALGRLAPDAPLLFPSRGGAESFSRIRIEPEVRTRGEFTFSLAYEQRFRYVSTVTGLTTLGVLPPAGAAPYRIRQLDWAVSENRSHTWRHEIDRASVRMQAGSADLTIGRQAIGWGRGVIFGAVDLFAPFSPLEADREWRRGIDAVHADMKLSDTSSVDVAGAFGPAWDRSLLAGRLRGYHGSFDVEAMAGRRARDLFAGFTTSAAVGDAEVHGEVATFRIPQPLPFNDARTIWKAVAGGSYRLPLGSGVLFYAEYHYSGFGSRKAEDVLSTLSDPAYAERFLRGDTQILLRHAIAVIASYEKSPMLTYSGQWLQSPVDGSGVASPGLTITVNDRMSIHAVGNLPYGAPPQGLVLRSEYGTASTSAFLQLRVYL